MIHLHVKSTGHETIVRLLVNNSDIGIGLGLYKENLRIICIIFPIYISYVNSRLD